MIIFTLNRSFLGLSGSLFDDQRECVIDVSRESYAAILKGLRPRVEKLA